MQRAISIFNIAVYFYFNKNLLDVCQLHCSGVEARVAARSPLQYSAEGSASNYYNARLYSDADNLLGEPLYSRGVIGTLRRFTVSTEGPY